MDQQQQQQLPADNAIDYINLLGGLSDNDSERRKKAEEIYNSIPAQKRFSILGNTLCRRELPQDVRVFAAILLRRLIIASWSDITNSIPAQPLRLSCNELLNLLRNSAAETLDIREKICHVIAALAKNFVDENTKTNQWSEFVQFMFELFGSPHIELRQCGYTIFTSYPEALGEINNQTAYIEQIHQCFTESYGFKGKPDEFYVSLVGATCSLILCNNANKECIKKLSTFAVPLVEILRTMGDESAKEEVCQHLIEVAEEAPTVFRPAIPQLLQTCINIMTESSGLESEVRYSALELVVSLIESAPNMIKKRAVTYIKPIVLRILALMSSIDDDPDWYTACSNEKDDDEPDAIGESALDRVSNSLGGKVLLPILMDELTEMLRKPEWQARHAALMAFSSAGEGCKYQLMVVLDRIVSGILTFLEDPHPRVRHAACNAIGQMATDFALVFANKFHSQVIPALCRLLVDFSTMRVQAHSACAMINVFEECPQDILAKYLDPIAEHIEVALSRYMVEGIPKDEGKLFVIENIIVALSSVADSSAELFVKYYEKFMPCLKFIIKTSTGNDDLRVLRGKAIECISLIGMAVGKEKFIADASEVMQLLLATQTGELTLADDDPQLSYMMAAWARICRIMGPDFNTYIPYVMEPVLKAASLKVELALLNDEDKEAIDNSSDWESVCVNEQAVGIRTAGLEDKATACSMLVCYARELKHGFADYVARTADVLIPLLKFPFHDDVRSAAAEAMPYLIESVKPKGDQCVAELWHAVFENIIAALDHETETSISNQLLESLGGCIEAVGPTSMCNEKHTKLVTELSKKFAAHFEELIEQIENRKDEDYEVESDQSDDQTDCLSGIASVIHSLFVVYRADYLPYFQPLIEPVLKLTINDKALYWQNKQTALCIWDDVIEYSGQQCVNYEKFFLPLLSQGIVDGRMEIRQAALYGIGQLAQQTGPTFVEFFQSVIPNMVHQINHPNSRNDELIMATENGISAVGKILKYCPQIANQQELLKCWTDWLPIWEDETEIPFVMGFLLELIEQNNQTVMGGPSSSNLPRLVAIVAEVFARCVVDTTTEVGMKLVSFLRQVHANPQLSACLGALSAQQQKAVQEVISGDTGGTGPNSSSGTVAPVTA